MTRAIVIPAALSIALEERDLDGLAQLQEAVGGYIEPITLSTSAYSMYVNEEGKAKNLDLNERATLLWWLLEPAAQGQDLIVGDAVLLADGPGYDVSDLRRLLQHGNLTVEVQLAGSGKTWVAGERRFDSWFEAAHFALALLQRFDFVVAVRICPS